MRVLIVHASEFGSTRGIAERIAAELTRRGHVARVAAAAEMPESTGYDAFVIGSAVHGGHWLKPAMAFVHARRSTLSTGPVWLFSSGPLGDRGARGAQRDPVELRELRSLLAPRDHVVFGGSFDRASADLARLDMIGRAVARRFLPEGDWRDWTRIDRWAAGIAQGTATPMAPVG